VISVVVCTYNRSELLANCLNSLAGQSLDKNHYEVVIADNNSSDDTLLIIEAFTRKESNFRTCCEKRRGANHARNAGVAIARGEYLAFIDDDAVAYSDWLSNILNYIAMHRDVVIFGGPYDAYTQLPAPEWFPPEYGILNLGEMERPVEIGAEWITGTNLIVRKDAFLGVGGFHEKLGSVENGIFYFGEETRLLIDLSDRGHTVYYVPSVKVKHLIRTDKMSLRYLLVSSYRMGRNHEITLNERRSLASHFVSVSVTVLTAIITMVSFYNLPIKRMLYYVLNPLFYVTGALVECMVAHTRLNRDT